MNMKLIVTICVALVINTCVGQTNVLSEKFLASIANQYTQKALTKKTQYFRMIRPLRKKATYKKAVQLRAKVTHSSKKTRYRERNLTVGFYAFEYASKKECSLSMDSLLLCFPNFCTKIERDKPHTGKLTPSVYIINDKTIYCIETFCEDENAEWANLVALFVDSFATKKSVILFSDCGKLEWRTKASFKK